MFKLIFLSFICFYISLHPLHAQNNWHWATSFGGKALDRGISKSADPSGSVYSAGEFRDTADFDPGPGVYNLITAPNSSDIYICKQDSNGILIWALQIGSGGFDVATSLDVDPVNGDVYVCGYFEQTVDFDPGPAQVLRTSIGNEDLFLLKLDSAGNFRWVYHAGGMSDDRANSLALEKMTNGYVYLTGKFENLVDFDPGPGNTSLMTTTGNDIFIVKTDTAGNLIWAKSINGNGIYSSGILHCISDPATGDFYATGYFSGTADLNPDSASVQSYNAVERDAFVLRLDSSGQFIWAAHLGATGTGNEHGNWIALRNGNEVLTTGYFEGTPDFNPGTAVNTLNSSGATDIYLSVLDTAGNYIAAKQFGGTALDFGTAVISDQNANVFLTGSFQQSIDVDPGPGSHTLTSSGGIDMFLVKLDANLNYSGAVKAGGTGSDYNTCMITDYFGNIIISGLFASNPMIFGTDTLTKIPGSNPDAFTAKCGTSIITALAHATENQTVSIYPNPASNEIHISAPPAKLPAVITVSGITGNVHFITETENADTILNLKNYPSGIYIISMRHGNQVVMSKFIIAK